MVRQTVPPVCSSTLQPCDRCTATLGTKECSPQRSPATTALSTRSTAVTPCRIGAPCREGYRAGWDTMPGGISCWVGYHAAVGYRTGWDTVPGGIRCRGEIPCRGGIRCLAGYRAGSGTRCRVYRLMRYPQQARTCESRLAARRQSRASCPPPAARHWALLQAA